MSNKDVRKQYLTPTAHKKMLKSWDANKTEDKLQTYLKNSKDAYNPETKRLVLGEGSYAYDPKKHASKLLQKAVFNHYYQNVAKSMTKYGRGAWRKRQVKLDKQVEVWKDYQVLSSTKKLQEWYREHLKLGFRAEGTVLTFGYTGPVGSRKLSAGAFTLRFDTNVLKGYQVFRSSYGLKTS